MGKRAKTHSAVAQQKHWDRLTLKHVENFSRDIIQNGANSGPFAGNPSKEGRQKTLLQHDDWIRADLKSCFFDEEGIHAPTESRLKCLPRRLLEIAFVYAADDDRPRKSLTCSEGSKMLPMQDDDQEDAATSDNRSDTGQSPLA